VKEVGLGGWDGRGQKHQIIKRKLPDLYDKPSLSLKGEGRDTGEVISPDLGGCRGRFRGAARRSRYMLVPGPGSKLQRLVN